MECLKSFFEGDGYSQTLKVFYKETLVFNGVADDFVTSANGELQIFLNFSGEKKFLHTMKRSGKFILLIPIIRDVDANIYLGLTKRLVLAWPLEDLENLWKQLRYDPGELEEIKTASSDELFLVWLISSQYSSIQSLDKVTLADAVAKNILSEDPEDMPSTIDVISRLNKGNSLLESVELFSGSDDKAVTAYLDDRNGSKIEWKSMSYERNYCLIGENLAIRIISA